MHPVWILCLTITVSTSCWAAETTRLAIAPDVYNGLRGVQPESQQAVERFAEAQQAAERGEASHALRLVHEALALDPDHRAARRLLGYEWLDGAWVTPYQRDQARRGYRWDARYGWVKPEDLSRYAAGERPDGRRWVSAAEVQERRDPIDEGWQVRTDHFLVTTNHSLEAGAALAAELENLYQLWRQRFAGYWATDREVRQLLAGDRVVPKPSRPFRVVYHRDKQGYVEHLRRRQPRIEETLGIYFDTLRAAHFYHAEEPAEAARLRPTLYHEAVHQMFQESAPKARAAGENANFWVIEGVACWFETLRPAEPGWYTIGRGGRLASAAQIASPLPIAELTAWGQSDLQRQPNLAQVYAQATALVAMLAEQQPETLVRYLKGVYYSRPDGAELSRLADQSYAELDDAYRRFAAERLPELAAVPAGH
ncbi:DUF1570 domain-containing protein [Botrimarina hoheduenensis]|uniref:DUF1570 domain-containing protein n=1 Tax=Botrimarina hoheduenensis TaxID=2528000 RepID=A0A5C5W707_9BACT|nr:DUF1570 domain-containing protein [Botrimarina hoheduenensis]TWT46394.1 hypothetical protein Pla111_14900 [Botrimarina hoheduenensis]